MKLYELLNRFEDINIYQSYNTRYPNSNASNEILEIVRFLKLANINEINNTVNQKQLILIKNVSNPLNGPLLGISGKNLDKELDIRFTDWYKLLVSDIHESLIQNQEDQLNFISDAIFIMTCIGPDDNYSLAMGRESLVGYKEKILNQIIENNDEETGLDIEYYFDKYDSEASDEELEELEDEEELEEEDDGEISDEELGDDDEME